MSYALKRRAFAWPVAFACLIAGFFAFANHAYADPRYPRSDDGGRLWRWASGGGTQIVAEAERFLGAGNVTGTPGPWCAAFASLVLRKTGHRPLASRMANAALSYGPHVARPKPGDLVVLRGHVGFVVADQGRTVKIVSGNWGHRVAFGTVSRAAVVAFVGT